MLESGRGSQVQELPSSASELTLGDGQMHERQGGVLVWQFHQPRK